VRAADAAASVPVVLASQSPRRRDLLDLVGIAHRVRPADVDESVRDGEAPDAYTERLALEKARAISAHEPGTVVVAADTTVVIDGEILGKPVDAPRRAPCCDGSPGARTRCTPAWRSCARTAPGAAPARPRAWSACA
jgi:predicted house-cleaning NTP pyrophosphatase (Maf/HAM1 superfamily)